MVSIPVTILFVLVGIGLVFYFAPAVKQYWGWVMPGAALTLVLWLAISLGLRAYVAHFSNYDTTYGTIGGVILLML